MKKALFLSLALMVALAGYAQLPYPYQPVKGSLSLPSGQINNASVQAKALIRSADTLILQMHLLDGQGHLLTHATIDSLWCQRDIEAIDGHLVSQKGQIKEVSIPAQEPIALAYVADYSTQAALNMALYHQAIQEQAKRNQVASVAFSNRVAVEFSFGEKLKPASFPKDTASHLLFDAAIQGIRLLETASPAHKILVLLTHGRDIGSQASYATLMEEARSKGIRIHVIALSAHPYEGMLGALADATGGEYHPVDTKISPKTWIADVEARARHYYTFQWPFAHTGGRFRLMLAACHITQSPILLDMPFSFYAADPVTEAKMLLAEGRNPETYCRPCYWGVEEEGMQTIQLDAVKVKWNDAQKTSESFGGTGGHDLSETIRPSTVIELGDIEPLGEGNAADFTSGDTLTFTDFSIDETPVLNEVQLMDIQFESAAEQVMATSLPEIDKAAAYMRHFGNIMVELRGHTDNIGAATENLSLSLRRAEQVKQLLVARGIEAKRIKTKGLGETVPLTDNTTEDARARNRRTEFVVVGY